MDTNKTIHRKRAFVIIGMIVMLVLAFSLFYALVIYPTQNLRPESTGNLPALHVPTQQEIIENGYPTNARGETYGPDIPEWDERPDLILAMNEQGVQGYLRAEDLEGAKTLEEAISYMQLAPEERRKIVSLYLQDGETVIGEFQIG